MKTNLIRLFCSLVLLAAALAVGQAAPPPLQMAPQHFGPVQVAPHLRLGFNLTCRAKGTPVEFPKDIYLFNNGPVTVPAGTKVHWTMTAPAHQGDYTFTSPLPPTKGVFLDGVLGKGVGAGARCAAKVLN